MKKVQQVSSQFHFIFLLLALGFLEPGGFSQTPNQNTVFCKSCPEYDFVITPDTYWKTFGSSHMADECRMFLVPVIPGYRYTFKTGCGDGATAGYDTHLELYRYSDCALITNNDNACELNRSKISWTNNSESYVILKVRGNGSSYGDFVLAYITSPPCVTCPTYDYEIFPVIAWQTHADAITENGCRIYKATVTAGTTYIFKTGCGNGATASFDTYLELLNMDCWSIAEDDDGCEANTSKILYTATYSGPVYLKVRGYNTLSAGNYTLAYRICDLPGHPGTIVGNTSPCYLSSQTYYVVNMPGMTYHWTFPTGWTVTAGGTTNSVTVTVGGELPGNIEVYASNDCGSSPVSALNNVTPIPAPVISGIISGNEYPCVGASEVYQVTNEPGVSYSWVFPTGWNQTTGGTTNSVTVTVGPGSGYVEVTPSDICGNGTTEVLAVLPVSTPSQPDPISGNAFPCEGVLQNYSVTQVPYTTYNWVVPGNVTQGNGTNSITAMISAPGMVEVTPVNGCGSGTPQILAVTPGTLPPALVTLSSMTILSGQSLCWGASQVLTVGVTGPFQVQSGGSARLIAGQRVVMLPGVSVLPNGYLHAYIATGCQYCGGAGYAPAMPLETAGSISPGGVVIKPSFIAYPNPTSGVFTLALTGMEIPSGLDVEICSITGEKVLTKRLSGNRTYELSIAKQPAGVYLLRVKSLNSIETIKIIKN